MTMNFKSCYHNCTFLFLEHTYEHKQAIFTILKNGIEN